MHSYTKLSCMFADTFSVKVLVLYVCVSALDPAEIEVLGNSSTE